MVNVLYSLSEFAKTLNLEHDSRIVPYALQLYTQASARTGTNSATPLACLELAGEKYGTALDRRMTARLAGVTVTIYKSELMRLHDLLGISSNIMRITLKSLVVQFGSISMLPRCEQVMKAFKERWSATLPSAQLAAVQWDRAVFPVGVFLACCKVASVRVDRTKLRLMSGERAEEINKVITLAEYYAAEELKTIGLSNLHSQSTSNRIKDVRKTQTRRVTSKAPAKTSEDEPTKRTRKRASKSEDQETSTKSASKDVPAAVAKRKRKAKEPEEESAPTTNEDEDEVMEEAAPIDDISNNNDNNDNDNSNDKTRRSTRQTRKSQPDPTVKKEPSSPKPKRQRRKAAANNESEDSGKSSKTNTTAPPEDDNNERIMQLREPPVDGINPMILPISWKETRQFAKAKDWKQKMLQKLRSASAQTTTTNANEE